MGIELDDDQLWGFLSHGHEGSLTTLRSDGWPIALPVWYVVKDRAVYLRTRPATKKLVRIRNDPRSSFLVSSGARWAELKAAVLTCRAVIIEDEPLQAEVLGLFDEKYAAFRTAPAAMPSSSQRHYKGEPVIIRLDVIDAVLSWDNSSLVGQRAEPNR
jgi:nitroimidazol reductase NimA-like FMN-containing flavoprotein (pyridoxamine 5'-phosphate oxidase superfamily)